MRFAAIEAEKVRPTNPLPTWARPWARPWTRPAGAHLEALDSGLFAGAALAALDAIIRTEPVFAGVWRARLALSAAAATARMSGRREGEEELRDAWFLRSRDSALGPAGGHLQAWRALAGSATLSEDRLRRAGEGFGLAGAPYAEMVALVERAPAEPNPIRAAAEVAAALYRLHPPAEFLALWLADCVLARRLRWPSPLPLIAAQIADPATRRAAAAKTSRPDDPHWEKLVTVAAAKVAAAAVDRAGELARRADKLLAESTKLRAKGAGAVVAKILEDDAIAPAACCGLSDRAMRRLADRLIALGAVRELTGRTAFRLYGL
jgi:hypothetical protein